MDEIQSAAIQRASAAINLVSGTAADSSGRLAARYLKAVSATDNFEQTLQFIDASRWIEGDRLKAAVSAYTTNNAEALITVGASFMAAVRARTLAGRLLNRVRKLPLNTPVIRQTAGARAVWVMEGNPIAMTAGTFVRDSALPELKVAGISVITRELTLASEADSLVSRDLERACAEALDLSFADPSNAGTVDESPASIFFGATSIPSSGPDASNFQSDFLALLEAFEGNLDTAAIICDTLTALQVSLLGQAIGDCQISLTGESRLVGLPVFFSTAVPRDSSGGMLGLVDLDRVDIVGMNRAELTVSREASIQMSDSPASGATNVVSLWQANGVGLLAQAYANWRAAPGAAVYISGTDYKGA